MFRSSIKTPQPCPRTACLIKPYALETRLVSSVRFREAEIIPLVRLPPTRTQRGHHSNRNDTLKHYRGRSLRDADSAVALDSCMMAKLSSHPTHATAGSSWRRAWRGVVVTRGSRSLVPRVSVANSEIKSSICCADRRQRFPAVVRLPSLLLGTFVL